jgi:DNA-binding beta-propeller fold protein YncE
VPRRAEDARRVGAGRRVARPAGAVALGCLISLCVAASPARAAAGFGLLGGAGGCLVAPGKEAKETASCGTAKALVQPNAVAVSPDGANVYVASGNRGNTLESSFGSLAVLKRNPETGAVAETACLSSDGTDGRDGAAGACTATPSLLGADGVAVSSDGNTVFVTSNMSGSVVAFARNPATGALTRGGCFQYRPPLGAPCAPANVYFSARDPVVSTDGKSLYIANPEYGAVSSFSAPPAPEAKAGASAPSPPGAGAGAAQPTVASVFSESLPVLDNLCIGVNGLDGSCAVGVAMSGVDDLVLSPDGHQLYAVAPGSRAIDLFARNSDTALVQSGCLTTAPPPGPCTPSSLKDTPVDLAVSPDGANLYAADTNAGGRGVRIDVLQRNTSSGALTDSSCVDYLPPPPAPLEKGEEESEEEFHERAEERRREATPSGPCSHAPGLTGVNLVAVSGDGSAVYAFGTDGGVFFARDRATGKLAETSCANSEDSRCASLPSLGGSKEGLAVSPDGHEVYFADPSSNAVFVYTLGASVASASAAATHAGAARVRVDCPRGVPRRCRGRVQLARLERRRARRGRGRVHVRRVIVGGSARFTIGPGRSATVSVQLFGAARSLLIARGHLRLAADVITGDPFAGGSGFGRRLRLSLSGR